MVEYTPERAERLNKISIPAIEMPVNIKIKWFEAADASLTQNGGALILHAHSFFEIHFVMSGKMCYESDGTLFEMQKGEALLIPPLTEHRCVQTSEGFLRISLGFSFPQEETVQILFKNAVTEKLPVCDGIAENIKFILRLCDKNDIFTPTIMSGRILEIIYSVCGLRGVSLPENKGNMADSRVAAAIEYINDAKSSIVTVKDVAKECCLSEKQLGRLFRQYTGQSVFEYITEAKMRQVKKLLDGNEYSIKEIGFMAGFESESAFVSFFKRHEGVTPGGFRRQSPG